MKGPHIPRKRSKPSTAKHENTKPGACPPHPAPQSETHNTTPRRRPNPVTGILLSGYERDSGRSLFQVKLDDAIFAKVLRLAEESEQPLADMIWSVVDLRLRFVSSALKGQGRAAA